MEHVHAEKVIDCDVCGKKYTCVENLKLHMKYHKPPEYVCSSQGCGKTFHQKILLEHHEIKVTQRFLRIEVILSIHVHCSIQTRKRLLAMSAKQLSSPSATRNDTFSGFTSKLFENAAFVTLNSTEKTNTAFTCLKNTTSFRHPS